MKDQDRRVFKAGSYIYIEGDEDVEEVFLVEKGLVEFKSSNEKVRSHGSSAGPGDVFGFISSLSRRPRMETAFAKVNSSVIIFSREYFLSVLKIKSDIAIKLLNAYADELRAYDTMILPLSGGRGLFLPEEIQLFKMGEYYFKTQMLSNALYVLTRYLELFPQGSDKADAQRMISEIRQKGIKRLPAPVPEGIYRRYADKQIIFCEHEPGDDLFIIKEGRVKILKHHHDSEVILSVLKAGDIFGELAIISDKPRNATAVSYGQTVVLPINKDSLLKLINKSSDLLKRIFTAISQRVWFTYIRMESKFYSKPATRIYVFLENKLIEDNVSLKGQEPHIFNFGIDELLKMTGIPAEKVAVVTEELSRDSNLNFYPGQTVIDNPSLVASKARYYRSRDSLYEGAADKAVAPQIPEAAEIEDDSYGIATSSKVPEPTYVDESADASGTLFKELDDELKSMND